MSGLGSIVLYADKNFDGIEIERPAIIIRLQSTGVVDLQVFMNSLEKPLMWRPGVMKSVSGNLEIGRWR